MKNIFHPKTVSIGIPALNEGRNISALIESLLDQKEEGFVIKCILVVSDGSTDNTVHTVNSFTDPRVEVIAGHQRKGKAIRQNEIISHCESDILVFLDADIKIDSDRFLKTLIHPILNDTADYTAGGIAALASKGIIDGVLGYMMHVKSYVYGLINYGDSVYTFYGPARAFSKKAYSELQFPKVASEDAFSYLQMQQKGMRYLPVPTARYYVRVPMTLADHKKQSVRFINSHPDLERAFGKQFVQEAYQIPFGVKVRGIIYALVKNPFYSFIYVAVFCYMKIQAALSKQSQFLWEAPSTSKDLN